MDDVGGAKLSTAICHCTLPSRNSLLVTDVACQSFVNDTRWHYLKDDRIKIARDESEINDGPIATYVTVVMRFEWAREYAKLTFLRSSAFRGVRLV